MPLNTDIDCLALGEHAEAGRHYLFLLDPADGRLVAAARYELHRGYLECVNLVADGYGPTLFLLLMQKARRDGLRGVAPDLRYNSDEAKRMDARFYTDAPADVRHTRNEDAAHAEDYLNQIYYLAGEVIAEAGARANADRYFDAAPAARQALVDRLERYLLRSELPFK